MKFTIIGGNVSGISAAIHLAEQGHEIDLYEKKIWRKPCGGGISQAFYDYLKKNFTPNLRGHKAGLYLHEMHKNKYLGVVPVDKNLGVTIDRFELQLLLLDQIMDNYGNINVFFDKIGPGDTHKFTPQTILATGIQRTGIDLLESDLLKSKYKCKAYSMLIPNTNIFNPHPDRLYLCYDLKELKGYRWVFPSLNYTDIGWGGFNDFNNKDIEQRFIKHIEESHGIVFNKEMGLVRRGWTIPITTDTPHKNFYNKKNGREFFAVGDLAGCVTLLFGGGIETGWLSSHLLSKSFKNGKLDPDIYARLLRKYITYQKPKILSNDFTYRFYHTRPAIRLIGKIIQSNWAINSPRVGKSRFSIQKGG